MKPLSDWRESLGEGPSATRRSRQRARLLATRRPSRARPLLVLAVGAAVALSVVLVTRRSAEPEVALTPGLELRGHLRFPEGSELDTSDDAVARLDIATDDRVELTVARGRIDAHVRRVQGRSWRYHAGPWTVRVLGTRLHVAYAPEEERIEVGVTEGAVEVTGPGGTAVVRAGEVLRRAQPAPPSAPPSPPAAAAVREPEPESDPTPGELAPVTPTPPRPSTKPVNGPLPPAPPTSSSPTSSSPTSSSPTEHGWREALRAGRRAEAVELVELLPIEERLALSDVEAMQVADAARAARRVELARTLLTQVEGHEGPSAAEAAFLLGRLEAQQHRLLQARDALRRALERAPGGAFAEQAAGRQLEVLLDLGGGEQARAAATSYLQRYPDGAWAPVARSALSRDGGAR